MDKNKIPIQILTDTKKNCEDVTYLASFTLKENSYTKTFSIYNPFIRKINKVNYDYPELGFIFKFSNN